MLRNKIAAILVLSLLSSSAISQGAKKLESVEYEAQLYTQQGQVNGCGLGFYVTWITDDYVATGVSGSLNFFFEIEKKNVFGMLKVTGIQVQGTTPSQKLVTYAWVQAGTHGRTTDFKGARGEQPNSFVGFKYSDPQLFSMPFEMATNGFILGINLDNQPLDHMVTVPAADGSTQQKIFECMGQLHDRMKTVFGK